MPSISFIVLLLLHFVIDGNGCSIGVNYGRVANNLPSPVKVVELLKFQGFTRVKLYDTDRSVLKALSGSGINVTVDLPNELLSVTARRPAFAYYWVCKNIASFFPSTRIEAVAIGNEVFSDPHNITPFLIPAMKNIHNALVKLNMGHIKVSSPMALNALQSSYPSSAGLFRSELVEPVFKPMLQFLRQTGSYLMVNAYPFFAYEANSNVISLDYALFKDNPGVVDSGNGLRYHSLFDAQIDAVFAAMSALKYDDIRIVVTETGWPSKGDQNEVGAGVGNAAAYNGNLIRRILTGAGTPARPNADLVVYIFALFNENRKIGPASERNYGLFYPNNHKVYDIAFTAEALQNSSGSPSQAAGDSGSWNSSNDDTWCVAKTNVRNDTLQQALDYACGEGGADCSQIQPGKACYTPNTIVAHASYAFNSYYQKNLRRSGTCHFQGASRIVSQEPPAFNKGKCRFPAKY